MHREAGAHEVLITGAQRWAILHENRDTPEPDIDALLSRLEEVDLVLIEGFKSHGHAKMEIHQNYDDVRSHWWCHSGHAQAYIGTRSNHDFVIHTNNNIRARFTNQGAFHLFDGTYNYIESADYRIYSNTSISDGYTGAIRTVARYNSNTSLFSHSQTGGTGGASRWTFGKNCYCFLHGSWWTATKRKKIII